MNVWSFSVPQLRALLQLLDMANSLRPEMERAIAAKADPANRAVAKKREQKGDD